MDNEKKDILNDEKVQKMKEDVTEKIADAASEIKEEIQDAEAKVQEVTSDGAEKLEDSIKKVKEESSEAAEAIEKKAKSVNLSVGALIGIVVGCVAAAALIIFLIMRFANAPTNYGKAEGSVVATVNGEKITDADMGYYIFSEAINQYYEIEGDYATGDYEDFDWDQEVDGKKLTEIIKENAFDNAINDVLTCQQNDKISDAEYKWSDEDDKQIQSVVASYVDQFGKEGFNLRARTMGIPTANEYARMYKTAMMTQSVMAAMEDDLESFIPGNTDLSKYVKDDRASVKHILIMTKDEEALQDPTMAAEQDDALDDAAALALAQQIVAEAKSGSDFDTLVEQYDQDMGQTTAGYTFRTGEMVPEFETAAFALDIDEISEPVKTDFGYHIIKRVAGLYEIQGSLREGANVTENKANLDKVSVKDVLNNVLEANEELEQEQMSAVTSE